MQHLDDRSLALDASSANTYVNRGNAYRHMSAFDKALQIKPDDADALEGKRLALAKQTIASKTEE